MQIWVVLATQCCLFKRVSKGNTMVANSLALKTPAPCTQCSPSYRPQLHHIRHQALNGRPCFPFADVPTHFAHACNTHSNVREDMEEDHAFIDSAYVVRVVWFEQRQQQAGHKTLAPPPAAPAPRVCGARVTLRLRRR